MIPWAELDERERAVWAATVGAAFIERDADEPDPRSIMYSTNLADRAVYALREVTKKGAYR